MGSGAEKLIGFGKHKGKMLKDLPLDYLSWMASKMQTFWKQIALDELARRSASAGAGAARERNKGNPPVDQSTTQGLAKHVKEASSFEMAEAAAALVERSALKQDTYIRNLLVETFGRVGDAATAKRIFDESQRRNMYSYHYLVKAYIDCGGKDDAWAVLMRMPEHSQVSQQLRWRLEDAYKKPATVEEAADVLLNRPNKNAAAWNSIISVYADHLPTARAIFEKMPAHDDVSLACLMSALVKANEIEELEKIYQSSPADVKKYNSVLATLMVKGYGIIHDVSSAKSVFDCVAEPDIFAWNTLIAAYATNGYLEECCSLFESSPSVDAATWSSLLKVHAVNHKYEKIVTLFCSMLQSGVAPNETVFTPVIQAMTSVEDLEQLLKAMTTDFQVVPSTQHWTAAVEVLGRLKQFEFAASLLDELKLDDERPWMALLTACFMHNDLSTGERAGMEVIKLKPAYPAAYVLLGALYNVHGREDKVKELELSMEAGMLKKVPGIATILVNGEWRSFHVGLGQDPELDKGILEVEERLEEAGHVQNTEQMIRATNELCAHSEKVAIVYGMLNTPDATPLRLHKNLRVCKNCHSSTKLISKLYGRSIILKDAATVHRFNDGCCSCGDYW